MGTVSQVSRQQPDVGAYTSLLSALDRDGRWEVALDAFGDTLADGVEVPWRTTTGAMMCHGPH